MRKFMSQRKALPSFAALRIDADNRPGAVSQNNRQDIFFTPDDFGPKNLPPS